MMDKYMLAPVSRPDSKNPTPAFSDCLVGGSSLIAAPLSIEIVTVLLVFPELPDKKVSTFWNAGGGFSTYWGLGTENMSLLYRWRKSGACSVGAAGPTRRCVGI